MKLPHNLDNICLSATQCWGRVAQEAVAVGEIGELLALFGKQAQGRATPEQWTDELADVIIMAHQLAVLHGGLGALEKRIAEKTNNIEARIARSLAAASGDVP
jgi:NTP pyrophosphatase (non-canonical NTP hydrolase)